MKTLLHLFLLFCLTFCLSASAQKTVDFNGKTYFVFDQFVDFYNTRISVDKNNLYLDNNKLPPIVGGYKDGQYLIYDSYFYLKNCKGKNFEQKCDTIRKVYATFNIVNGKKNGEAEYYDYINQEIYLKLPYVNDQVDGSFQFKINRSFHFNYEKYNIPNPYYRFNQPFGNIGYFGNYMNACRYEMNFKKGVPDGKQKLVAIYKKFEYNYLEINFKEGLMDGEYTQYVYSKDKNKLTEHHVLKGRFRNGTIDGRLEFENRFGHEWISIFKEGKLQYEETYDALNKIKTIVIIGDTVDKIIGPEYKARMFDYYKFSQHKEYQYLNMGNKYLFITLNDNNIQDTIVKLETKVSRNFYSKLSGFVDFKDTIVLGKPCIRIWNYRWFDELMNESVYKVDSGNWYSDMYDIEFNEKEVIGSGKSYLALYERSFNGGEWQNLRYFDGYFHLLRQVMTDSMERHTTFEKNISRTDELEINSIYDFLTHKQFKSIRIIEGKKLIASIDYRRIVHDNRSYLIAEVVVITNRKQFQLFDTLFCENKEMYPLDAVLQLNFFNLIPGYYNLSELYQIDNINYPILHFMVPNKIKHQAVFVNGKRFNGRLTLDIDYTSKFMNPEFKEMSFVNKETKLKTYAIEISIGLSRNDQRVTSEKTFLPIETMHQNVVDGYFNGYFKSTGKWKQSNFSGQFNHNKLDDYLRLNHVVSNGRRLYDYRPEYYKNDYRSIFTKLKRNKWIEHYYKLNYMNGSLNDVVNLVTNNINLEYDQKILLNVHSDVLKGHQIIFSGYRHDQLSAVFDADSGLENSKFKLYGENGIIECSGTIKNGRLHNEYFNLLNHSRLKFENGKKIDTGYYFNYDQILLYKCFNYKYKKVSRIASVETNSILSLYRKLINENSGYTVYPNNLRNLAETPADTTEYIYYFSNGQVYSHGLKETTSPIGRWEFYRENKSVYKLIDFKDTLLLLKDTGKTYTYAYVTAFYPNGQVMYKGYSTHRSVIYSCSSQTYLPTDNIYYLEFYDSTGKSLLNNGSGFITEYLPDGKKLREGNILNYKKTGIWVEYDRFGIPTAIGRYENGLKVGHWIEGDLGGVNLPNDICFMDEEEFNQYLSKEGKNLKIEEKFYLKGNLIQTNYYRTTKE